MNSAEALAAGESGEREALRPAAAGTRAETAPRRSCGACSAAGLRARARFCPTCGCALDQSYHPADALRASYHRHVRRNPSSRAIRGTAPPPHSMKSLFQTPNRNSASAVALAFVTYALVPYLGILFCPGAVLMGAVGLINSFRAPERGGQRASYASIFCGLLILSAQILLWWILVKVPEWIGGF